MEQTRLKMILLVCLVMLISKAAAEDLSTKMFTFPERSSDAFVQINTAQSSFSAVTLCHRSFTALKRSHSFFSLTTPDQFHQSYAYQTLYNYDTKEISVWVKSVRADFGSIEYLPNKWYSICTTWDSNSGVVQLWMNGQPYTKKYNVEFPLTGQPKIILGQEQSKYDSLIGFTPTMSFSGMLTDVHMWDRVLSACEIQSYMSEQSFTPGNVVNWAALDYTKRGRLTVDDKQNCHVGAK